MVQDLTNLCADKDSGDRITEIRETLNSLSPRHYVIVLRGRFRDDKDFLRSTKYLTKPRIRALRQKFKEQHENKGGGGEEEQKRQGKKEEEEEDEKEKVRNRLHPPSIINFARIIIRPFSPLSLSTTARIQATFRLSTPDTAQMAPY